MNPVDAMRIHRCACLATVIVVAVAGCHDVSTSDEGVSGDVEGSESSGDVETGAVESGSTGDPEVADACAAACVDTQSLGGASLCHSCRCKVAFDDWLPSVDELQCANGVSIVSYNAELSDTDHVLDPTPPGEHRCANPSLLTGSCRQGSKLGQITHDDVSFYWICRDPYLDYDGSVLYDDMAIIGHNMRSGATCFWDDVDDVIHEDDAPPLDLLEASEEERARSVELFHYNDGSNCITCHDHDPFIYTPYLQSTEWRSVAADKGPYHVVGLDGRPRSTGIMHLVSERADACTSCHRLGSDNTCSYFAPDSLGIKKNDSYDSQVHQAAEPGSPYWRLAHWMPGGTEELADFVDWDAQYGDARAHVLECCESPGVDVGDCRWAPVPVQ